MMCIAVWWSNRKQAESCDEFDAERVQEETISFPPCSVMNNYVREINIRLQRNHIVLLTEFIRECTFVRPTTRLTDSPCEPRFAWQKFVCPGLLYLLLHSIVTRRYRIAVSETNHRLNDNGSSFMITAVHIPQKPIYCSVCKGYYLYGPEATIHGCYLRSSLCCERLIKHLIYI